MEGGKGAGWDIDRRIGLTAHLKVWWKLEDVYLRLLAALGPEASQGLEARTSPLLQELLLLGVPHPLSSRYPPTAWLSSLQQGARMLPRLSPLLSVLSQTVLCTLLNAALILHCNPCILVLAYASQSKLL